MKPSVSFVLVSVMLALVPARAESLPLVPMPRAVTEKGGLYTPPKVGPQIARTTVPADEVPPEGYRLSVTADGIKVSASDDAGFFYAGETLKQLAGKDAAGHAVYPCVEIEDAPRYPWRGLLVDESRHFFGKKEILSILEHMSEFKLNVLHWHLTDDEGWRLALEKYPALAARASWIAKNPFDKNGGKYGPFFYTADDVREVLAFAKARHVRVMPEIDLPGHSRALLTAYPELGCAGGGNPREVCPGKDSTLRFLEGVLDAVCALFDSPFIHVGGDECERTGWAKCPDCQTRMKAGNLKDVKELQSWFTRHFTDYLAKKGRRLVGWDEILEGGLPAGAVVMSWRGAGGGIAAAAAGHDVVMTPNWYCYFDYPQGLPGDKFEYYTWKNPPPVTLAKVFSFDPCAGIPPERRRHVLGGQGNSWAEFTRTPAELEWKLWPRACALAEALWTAPAERDYAAFAERCAVRRARLVATGVNAAPVAADAVPLSGHAVIPLWPKDKMPLAQKGLPPEQTRTDGGVTRISNVAIPALTAYPVKGGTNVPAVVVCPGGGYRILACDVEGTEIADWLNKQGIAAFILKYRVCENGTHDPAFCDAQRAISLVRSRAAEFGLDPAKIGMMGFSAGANLTARTSSDHRKRLYTPIDGVDQVPCRPDFSLVIYPWALVTGADEQKNLPLTLRPEFPVDAATPPTFLVQAMDDGCHVENALGYCAALKSAGVAAELHVFPDGSHGYGIRKHGHATDGWEVLAAKWLARTLK